MKVREVDCSMSFVVGHVDMSFALEHSATRAHFHITPHGILASTRLRDEV